MVEILTIATVVGTATVAFALNELSLRRQDRNRG